MAKNIDTSTPTPALYMALLDFEAALTPEQKTAAKIPSQDDSEWFGAVLAAFEAANAEPDAPKEKGEKGTRKAQHYTVLLLLTDGPTIVVGSGLGSIGRESKEPRLHSAARKVESMATLMNVKRVRDGKAAGHILTVPTSDVVGFAGIEAPKDAPAAAEPATAETAVSAEA